MALERHASFLPGAPEPDTVMDRLHAWCYFLEALLAEPDRADCAAALGAGIGRAAALLGEIAPRFARSDVYAQLLRVRLVADSLRAVKLDEAAAGEEAGAIPGFQYPDPDPRLHGAFSFGRRGGVLLGFANPVSTMFCAQALEMWRRRQSGEAVLSLDELI
jgi:hypothetical protein